MGILLLLGSGFALWECLILRGEGMRRAGLQMLMIHCGIIALTTELLSTGRLLNSIAIHSLWLTLLIFHGGLYWRLAQQRPNPRRQAGDRLHQAWRNSDGITRLGGVGIGLILGITGLIAVLAPPNNADAMIYHLPRVMHWIQNHSVAPYPTPTLRQISFAPGASYIVTHIYLLMGNDRGVNLVQWLAFGGAIAASSLIVQAWGGDRRTQIFAGLLIATTPMAILQAMTPQTDLLTAFWLLVVGVWVVQPRPDHWWDFLWLSLALGLALVTKATAFIFALPLGVLWVGRVWRQWPRKQALLIVLVMPWTSLLFSLPYLVRNGQLFGNILGSDEGTLIQALNLGRWLSNSLRYLALNLPFPGFWQGVERIHQILGIDPNDPATSFAGGRPFLSPGVLNFLIPDHDFVASPLVVILLAIATLVLIFKSAQKRSLTPMLAWAIATWFSFILFCALIKWQVWGNRLLLPFLLFAAPIIAFWLSNHLSKAMGRSLVGLLLLGGLFYSLTAVHHPLIPLPFSSTATNQAPALLTVDRRELYLASNGKALAEAYEGLTGIITANRCQFVGLSLLDNDWEYPFWVLPELPNINLKYFNVNNVSETLPSEFADEKLCMVIIRDQNQLNYQLIEPQF